MSSRGGRRQPKIPRGSYPREEAVKLRGTVGAPSPSPARIGEPPCGGCTDLMEKVVERSNMLRALHRVESNKGAAGADGMEINCSPGRRSPEGWGR
ncbi:hypothetical protein [Moorella sulfitireducens (nom. illeg.)]|uniref:hypothetical protein n=1 Tax=Neomoorella sulfitireducens TaxID=2972948 RepID=UPI0021AD2EF5|nr:hypothetical protein [Moorella sulfitireducens]